MDSGVTDPEVQEKVQQDFVQAQIEDILDRMVEKDEEAFFTEPVPEDIPQYYETVEQPMDMSTMREKNQNREYKTLEEFHSDFRLMIDNCRGFNERGSFIVKEANRIYRCMQRAVDRAEKTFAETFGTEEDVEEEEESEDENDDTYSENNYYSTRRTTRTSTRGRRRGSKHVMNQPSSNFSESPRNSRGRYDPIAIQEMEQRRARQMQQQRENALRQRIMEQHFARKRALKQRTDFQKRAILQHQYGNSVRKHMPWVSDDFDLENVKPDALIHFEVLLERRILAEWSFMEKKNRVHRCVIPHIDGKTMVDDIVAKHKLLEMKRSAEFSGGSQYSSGIQHFRLQDSKGVPQPKRFCARSNLLDFTSNTGTPSHLWSTSKMGEIDGFSELQLSQDIASRFQLVVSDRQEEQIKSLEEFGIDSDFILDYIKQ